jgi:hypothetical protein
MSPVPLAQFEARWKSSRHFNSNAPCRVRDAGRSCPPIVGAEHSYEGGHRTAFSGSPTPLSAVLSLQRARIHAPPRSNVRVPINAPTALEPCARCPAGTTNLAPPTASPARRGCKRWCDEAPYLVTNRPFVCSFRPLQSTLLSSSMRRSHNMQRRLPDGLERIVLLVASVAGWVGLFFLYWLTTANALLFSLITCGPSVLTLTYLALGGNIPSSWRQKGYSRFYLIALVFWLSFIIALVVSRFLPPQFD